MSTLVNRPGGHRWIQFRGPGGSRHTLCLGRTSKSQATYFQARLDALLAARMMNQAPDPDTAHWVSGLGVSLRRRLAAVGLIATDYAATLGELADASLASREDVPGTAINLRLTRENLIGCFGREKLLGNLTPEDGKRFLEYLKDRGRIGGGGLSRATSSRRHRIAKQMLTFAVKKNWLHANPFPGVGRQEEANYAKRFFVDPPLFLRVLREARNQEFRAILVLARFGGLRCPSEIQPMRWSQIDPNRKTILVMSPKTKRYARGGERTIPLFQEILGEIGKLPRRDDLLFPNHQKTGQSLTDELQRVCRWAGVALWPKPWHNMRATRETELMEDFPIQVVASWMGHSPSIALTHYAQTTKDHLTKAVKMDNILLKAE